MILTFPNATKLGTIKLTIWILKTCNNINVNIAFPVQNKPPKLELTVPIVNPKWIKNWHLKSQFSDLKKLALKVPTFEKKVGT